MKALDEVKSLHPFIGGTSTLQENPCVVTGK